MPDSRPTSAPAADEHVVAPAPGPLDHIRRTFGRYRIMDRIGHGGMGAVFRALDTQLDRVVALKVPFLGGDDSDEARQRFYREARAAATLHHPNLCPVFDVGEVRGMPFLTMALIEGRGLDRVLKESPLAPPHAAALVRKLALAMQAAHDRGVVHRDLKPSNVLIRPDGEPVIMDFGLARRAGDQASEGLTRRGDVLGTIEYMSPEQLDGDNDAVGPAADVYALGVVLYEALTAARPFTGSAGQVLAAILVKPPPRPSDARPGVPARLDEICGKAMARRPAERYETMAAFAAALTDYLRSARSGPTPVVTPPAQAPSVRDSAPTRPVRETVVSKGSARRGPTPADEAAPAPSPPLSTGRRKRRSARRRAERSSKRPLILGAVALVVAALIGVLAVRPSRPVPAPDVVSAASPPAVTGAAPHAPSVTPPAPKPSASPVSKGPPVPTPPPIRGVRVHAADVSLAVGEKSDVTIEIDWAGYHGPLVIRWDVPPEVRVTPAGPITVRAGGANPVVSVALVTESAGPLRVGITATPTDGAVRHPVSTAVAVRPTPGPCTRVLDVAGAEDSVGSMAFAPDASLALVGSDKVRPDGDGPAAKGGEVGGIRVWDLARGRSLAPLVGHTGRVTGLAVAADGKAALSTSADETVILWDLTQGRRASQSPKQPLRVLTAALSPDAKRGLVAYPGLLVKTDLEKFQSAGAPIKTAQLTGSDALESVLAVAVSRDRKGLAGGIDGKLFLLDLAEKSKTRPLAGLKEAVRSAAFSPAPGVAATGSGGVLRVGKLQPAHENAVCLWDAAAGTLKWRADEHTSPVVCVAFSADGRLLASGGEDGGVRVWDAATGQSVAAFKGHTGRVLALAFPPDGNVLLSGSADRTVRTWRLP